MLPSERGEIALQGAVKLVRRERVGELAGVEGFLTSFRGNFWMPWSSISLHSATLRNPEIIT